MQRLVHWLPKKRLEYLEQEVSYWHRALEIGESPTLGEVTKLASSGQKIHQWLIKNRILPINHRDTLKHALQNQT